MGGGGPTLTLPMKELRGIRPHLNWPLIIPRHKVSPKKRHKVSTEIGHLLSREAEGPRFNEKSDSAGWPQSLTGKTTAIRRIAFREAGVSRIQRGGSIEGTPWNPPCITALYRIEGFKGGPIIPRNASLSGRKCGFFCSLAVQSLWKHAGACIYIYIYTYIYIHGGFSNQISVFSITW